MSHEFTRKNEKKTTLRLKNNRYRVLMTDGTTEVIFADTRGEAATIAAKAGYDVRYVAHVQNLHRMPKMKPISHAPLLMGRLCGLALMLAPVFAHAECVEDAMNRPGTDGAYPTGCFVKPTPVEPDNCIAWDNIGPDRTCLQYHPDADAETIVPGEALEDAPDETQVPVSEYQNELDPLKLPWWVHHLSCRQDRDGWQARALQAEAAQRGAQESLEFYADIVGQIFEAAGIQ